LTWQKKQRKFENAMRSMREKNNYSIILVLDCPNQVAGIPSRII
jgi:hypothetical protein